MGAAVISISDLKRRTRQATWSLLEVARPGEQPVPYGILLVDAETDDLTLRFRAGLPEAGTDLEKAELEEQELEEQELDILDVLESDLRSKASEMGGSALLASLEDALSNWLRISDRTAISYSGNPQLAADRLFDRYVDAEVRPWETHLPLYGLRAAATRFGEGMAAEEEGWLRAPEHLRLTPGMFVAHVVGKSMEPLIPDDSLCIFRGNVTGTRQGRYLLIEKYGENDFASRYTVKRYTSRKTAATDDGEWEHSRIRLEPRNPDFEAFELHPDEFRVVAEFVEVLGPA